MAESRQDKDNKPQDNVLTPDQKPSVASGLTISIILLSVGLFVAAIYYGLLNL